MKAVCGKYIDSNFSAERKTDSDIDHVLEYVKEALTLGMIFLEVKDAIREGDGIRVLRCWKYFFRGSGHTNYCAEGLTFLAQYYYVFPPRLAEQMLWGRFVNYEGKKGKNFSTDLQIWNI